MSLVGAVNENKTRIDNNVTSITGIKTDIGTMKTDIATNKTGITNLWSAIDMTEIEAYMLANPINV
jgi:hypothetical protein